MAVSAKPLQTGRSLTDRLRSALAEPFDAKEVKWKPQAAKGDKAMAVPYVDARLVMDRLDAVFGVGGWQDAYELLPQGSVMCKLSVLVEGVWITRSDVGSESDQPDEGDKMKAAYSDALKRAAIKFSVGRYLYSIPKQWVDYDAQRKRLVQTPSLPAWAVPSPKPRTGQELAVRMLQKDAELSSKGYCKSGELMAFVRAAGAEYGLHEDLARWGADGIDLAWEKAIEFIQAHQRSDAQHQEAKK